MTTNRETNPPARKEEDFPKTTTIPEGWATDALMEVYNSTGAVYDRGATPLPVPATGYHNGKANGKAQQDGTEPVKSGVEDESLFSRRLEPFPSTWELTGIYL